MGKILSSHIDLEFRMRSSHVGPALAYFYIEIEDGPPISFQCQAEFRGPLLSLSESCVDMGLAKVNTVQAQQVMVTNESPIPAQILVKSAKNKRLSFETVDLVDSAGSSTSLRSGKPFITRKGNNIEVSTYRAVL